MGRRCCCYILEVLRNRSRQYETSVRVSGSGQWIGRSVRMEAGRNLGAGVVPLTRGKMDEGLSSICMS